jgi:hypothetical protein
VLRRQFQRVHGLLAASTDRILASEPAPYALTTVCEDIIVNVLAARKPLALSTWSGRTGLSELPPLIHSIDRRAWASRVQIDLAALRCYARAVYAETDAYLASAAELQSSHPTTGVLNALLVRLWRCQRS